MKPNEKYKSADAFRGAISQKAKANKDEDTVRIYRKIAFGRLLNRLAIHQPENWILKGGHALEIRFEKSRATKDVDIAINENKISEEVSRGEYDTLRSILIEASEIDLGDFFAFVIEEGERELENAVYGGARFLIDAQIGDRTFVKFHLDVAAGDSWIEPHDKLMPESYLDFAGVESFSVKAISIEQHFAEKFHAYTLPREEGKTNSRVKDMVDMVLFIRSGVVNQEKLIDYAKQTFTRRKTHEIPDNLLEPPAEWKEQFESMAKELEIEDSIEDCFKQLKAFLQDLIPVE